MEIKIKNHLPKGDAVKMSAMNMKLQLRGSERERETTTVKSTTIITANNKCNNNCNYDNNSNNNNNYN